MSTAESTAELIDLELVRAPESPQAFRGKVAPDGCAGCGDVGVLNALQLAHFDLGLSFRGDQDVLTILKDGFVVSAQLGVLSFLVAAVLGIGLGILSALNRNRALDYAGVFIATAGAALPSFVLATFLTIIFAVHLGWFDVLGW